MRTIILSIFTILLLNQASFSQQIPNSSFENWSTRPTWGYLPTSWYGTNYVDLNYVGVTRETDNPVDGDVYVKLTAESKTIFGTTYKVPGGLTLSDLYHATKIDLFKEGKPKAGVAFTARPTRLTGYYKYTSINNDSYYMSVALTKWRGTTRDTIGYVEQRSSQSVTDWSKFELPIQYRSADIPDTLNIVFLTTPVFKEADLSKVQVGSSLSLDKLEFIMEDFFKVDFTYTGNPCTGGTLTFSATSDNVPGDSWEWSVNGVAAGNGATMTYNFPEVEVPTDFNVKLKGTNNQIGSDEITKVVTIHPRPVITLLPENPYICPKSSITLTAGGGISYQWNTAGSGSQITVTPMAYATYIVTGTDQYGCTNSASTTIFYHSLDTTTINAEFCSNESYSFFDRELTLPGTYFHALKSVKTGCDSTIRLVLTAKPIPVVTLTSDKEAVCPGSTAILTATSGMAGYDWGSGIVETNTYTINPIETKTYSVTVTGTNGCSSTGEITIVVNPTNATSNEVEICEGESAVIFGEIKTEAGNYTKTFNNVFGCDSVVTTTLIVNELPDIFNVTGSGSYSPGEDGLSVLLSGSQQGIVYKLIKENELIKSMNGNGEEISFGIQPAGKYLIRAENIETGCIRMMKDTAIITLLVGIDIKVDFSYAGNPCTGGTLTFSATSDNVPGDSWEWSVNGITAGNGVTMSYNFPEVEVPTDFNVKLKGTNNQIGSDEITKVVTIHPKPVITLLPENPFICPKSSITLTAGGGISYQWNTAGSGSQITVTPMAYATYIVTGTDQYGCTNSASSMIFYHNLDTTTVTAQFCSNESYSFFDRELTLPGTYFHALKSVKTGCDSTIRLVLTAKPIPVATLTSDKEAVCPGSSALLTATPGMAGYDWGAGFVAGNTLTVKPDSPQIYSVTVKSENGCSVSLSKEISLLPVDQTESVATICFGDSTLIFGEWVKQQGTYRKTYSNRFGCDSVSVVTLNVTPLPIQFTVEGTGGYSPDKEGRSIIQTGSEDGTIYRLMKDGQSVKSVPGNGDELSFGLQPAGQYVVIAENSATGCTTVMNDTVVITLLVGIDIKDMDNATAIYPNPVNDKVYISVSEISSIRFFNNSGQVIMQIPDFQSSFINVQSFSSGIYIVEIVGIRGSSVHKLIKK